MPFAKTDKVWMNGKLVAWDQATIHVCSHVIHYGSCIFEGIRCYKTPQGPAIFRLKEHIERLFDGCRIYRMEIPFTREALEQATVETVRINKMEACYIRPLAYRGYESLGVDPFPCPIDVAIAVWPWGAYLGKDATEKGVDVMVSSWRREAPDTLPTMAKASANYMNSQLIKMEALANGFDEAIALGPDGMISEGSGQNVFIVHRGTVYTTPLNGTLLPGITRDSIITLARDAGLEVRETPLQRDFLYAADEIFLTGTASEVTPVRSIDRLTVGEGRVGEVTRMLQRTFLDLVQGKTEDRHNWLCHVRAERASAT
jgi:branched-chain amino acid aminotransferase